MKRDEKDLLKHFRALPPQQQETRIAFAAFLAGRVAETPQAMGEPQAIPRPKEEKVVQAIKRLRLTYPMLDHGKMLHELSEHMTQHLMLGKPRRRPSTTSRLCFAVITNNCGKAEKAACQKRLLS